MKATLAELPPVGLGCSPYRAGERVDLGDAIERALALGYRLLDTAEAYGNEAQIGEILRHHSRSFTSRPIVVSKVWQTNHEYRNVLAACEGSLQRLGVEALDLYLIHAPQAWRHTGPLGDLSRLSPETARSRTMPVLKSGARPMAAVPLSETWLAMEELCRRGLTRAIGVSNFDRGDLEELLAGSTVPPAVNQIERHPYLRQDDLVAFCHEHEIRVMAHSPLSAPGLLDHPGLAAIASRVGKSPAQVILRWNLELEVVPIPSSLDPLHQRENLALADFALEASDMAEIDGLAGASAGDPS